MPDSEAKKKWDKKNVVFVTTKFFRATEKDLLEYLEGKQKSTTMKKALREYMKNHPDEE